jgi:hypothetical protein
MTKPFELQPATTTAADHTIAAERLRSRTRRWVDLHSALSQLLEAQALAVEDQTDGEGSGK